MLVLIRAVFSYLDRFYVKRFNLDTLSVLLTKAINVRNTTLGFPPFPLLPERDTGMCTALGNLRDAPARAVEESSETGEDAAVADATPIPIVTAAFAGMEAAVQQWEAQHSA